MDPLNDPQIEKEQLGQMLLQQSLITEDQLKGALKLQKSENLLLGEALAKLGYASEEDVVQALSLQHNFPYLPLANYDIDDEVIKIIPEDVARRFHAIPVDKMGDILTVVLGNPLNSVAISEIEAHAKCKVEIFIATHKEIQEAIDKFYKDQKQ